MRMQIWPCHRKVKGHPKIIIWLNLVDLKSQVLYTKIQPWSFLGSGEEYFRCFLPYMGIANILPNDAESFEQNWIDNTFRQKVLYEIWWKLVKLFQKKKTLQDFEILYLYIAHNCRGLNFCCNWKCWLLWSCIVSFSQWSLTHYEKLSFQYFPHTNAQGRKIDLAIKRWNVNVGLSFEETW